ncbi:MAG: DUF4864 domain-containing protein [Burkholderiales bacterium]|nr:DUF4864 domain-containing protein [Burkholderiales bacterium]
MFTRLLAVLAVLAALSSASSATAAKTPRLGVGEWRAIQAVIARQMDAFRLNDGDVAFSLASPSVRQVFESADNFMDMVRTEYGAVYRPRTYRFLKPAMLDGEPLQPVEVIALDGAVSIAVFSLERQPNRSWRISGCHLLESKQFAI